MTRSGTKVAIALHAALGLGWTACSSAESPPLPGHESVSLLRGVETWAMQLQGIAVTSHAAVRLRSSSVDLVVIEPTRSVRGHESFDCAELVRSLQNSTGSSLATKRCVAYLNIGQAEDYRTYWQENWRAPTEQGRGEPEFLLGIDPDGWSGNYPVAYWSSGWQQTLFGSPDAPLDQILADGFDGVYLDWVLGCVEPRVVAAARQAGVDPRREMVALLRQIRAYAHARSPLFVLIAQNGVDLAISEPDFLATIDGFAHEDLCFSGSAGAAWDDAESGDHAAPDSGPWSTAALGDKLRRIRAGGTPVFTIDYAIKPDNIEHAEHASRALGLVPFVSHTPLDRLPARVMAAPR